MENSLSFSVFSSADIGSHRRNAQCVDAGNLLTAITMARSLIETGATVRHLIDAVKEATKRKDVEALDQAVMSVGFATRFEEFAGDNCARKGRNILTLIDRMDKSVFKKPKPRFRKAYDFLSEFVHPNHLGTLGLYSQTFPKEYRVEFGKTAQKKENILPHLRVTLSMVLLVELAVKDLERLTPDIIAFVPK